MLPPSIQIQPDPAALLTSFFKQSAHSQVVLLLDTNTEKFCYPLIKHHLPPHRNLVVEAGEEHKTLSTCTQVWSKLTEFQCDRHSLLVILGGGVLGDLGGFCAATFKRGIGFVLIPTTLLAQVDASVGGKLGIDFEHYKNHIGVFQEPLSTLISPAFLSSLPARELRSGFAEVIKHCLISDRAQWEALRQQEFPNLDWPDLIRHSVEFKAGVITRDPREQGERKILNFGHTVGHAIESLSLTTRQRLFHGEAIAAGMIVEANLAKTKGLLSETDFRQIQGYLQKLYGRIELPASERIIALMRQDKKNKGKAILMALPKDVGRAVWDVEISEVEIQEALAGYDL